MERKKLPRHFKSGTSTRTLDDVRADIRNTSNALEAARSFRRFGQMYEVQVDDAKIEALIDKFERMMNSLKNSEKLRIKQAEEAAAIAEAEAEYGPVTEVSSSK